MGRVPALPSSRYLLHADLLRGDLSASYWDYIELLGGMLGPRHQQVSL